MTTTEGKWGENTRKMRWKNQGECDDRELTEQRINEMRVSEDGSEGENSNKDTFIHNYSFFFFFQLRHPVRERRERKAVMCSVNDGAAATMPF